MKSLESRIARLERILASTQDIEKIMYTLNLLQGDFNIRRPSSNKAVLTEKDLGWDGEREPLQFWVKVLQTNPDLTTVETGISSVTLDTWEIDSHQVNPRAIIDLVEEVFDIYSHNYRDQF